MNDNQALLFACGLPLKLVLQVCPYFATKELATNAELIFMPYNYITDATLRRSLDKVALDGAILIFDEAHNVEASCTDTASFDLTAGSKSSLDYMLNCETASGSCHMYSRLLSMPILTGIACFYIS